MIPLRKQEYFNMNNKQNLFSNNLTAFREFLSLTQAQIADNLNKELNLVEGKPGYLTQSYINKLEKGGVITDKRVTSSLLKKIFLIDSEKLSSIIDLSSYIYNVMDKSKIDLPILFSISTRNNLIKYINESLYFDKSSKLESQDISAKFKIISDNLSNFPSKILVEQTEGFEFETNTTALIVLYIALQYISELEIDSSEYTDLKEIIDLYKNKTEKAFSNQILSNLFYTFTGTTITSDMNMIVKSKLIKSFQKRVEISLNIFRIFKDCHSYYSESVLKYKDILQKKENIPQKIFSPLNSISNIISLDAVNSTDIDDFSEDEILELYNIIGPIFSNFLNSPLNFLCCIYDFYLHQESCLTIYPNPLYIEEKYKEIINYIDNLNKYSFINSKNILDFANYLYEELQSYYSKGTNITKEEFDKIQEYQYSILETLDLLKKSEKSNSSSLFSDLKHNK